MPPHVRVNVQHLLLVDVEVHVNRSGMREVRQINVRACQTGIQSNVDPQRFSDVVSNQPEAANGAADKLGPSKPPTLTLKASEWLPA
jgi:hypothetical protein